MKKTKVKIRNLKIVYDNGICAVKNLSFKVHASEFVCILGPSGCGKTTLLNAIAGFIKPAAGSILINNEPVVEPTQKTGVVFQSHALFPWKTVSENIGFGSKLQGINKHQRKQVICRYIRQIGLQGFENKYPPELSAGMQQRVAIARALANEPEIILMDEPFKSLDSQTKKSLQELLLGIWAKDKRTVIFVTHDIDEAIFLSDRVLIMTKRPGKLKKEIRINLPRPRNFKTILKEKYLRYKEQLHRLLEN